MCEDEEIEEGEEEEEDMHEDVDDDEVLREPLDMYEQNGSYGFSLASANLIEKLKRYGIYHQTDQDACCSICKEEFLQDSQVGEMPCSRVFHYPCIVQWLLIQNSYPLCRSKID
ncbi:hypothetical protein AQUCO_03500002v1 [Aquilegia coerulea]|uniref:RING-type E3 ubiquitin transferase n=1 Tax=Aquilegia coerulea TaxID=218851 RepID=A0A2G5CVH7_AQUCA|nr:hypothetical protein AQUCO_03500002v1 [Aquilegia coerulea]